jgi:hypothetical protein
LSDTQWPEPGDHIWVKHRAYSHHGLYLGENNDDYGVVIHYAGWADGLDSGPLELIDLDDFTRGRTLYVRDYKDRPFAASEVIDRAMSRLGEDTYDVHSNNCEHFCAWAITGQVQSRQVDWVDTILGAIHPGLEATSRTVSAIRSPNYLMPKKSRVASTSIARDFAIDMGVKSAARWVAGPYGVAAYVGYRVAKQLVKQRSV